jgi:hypothetical protein
MPVRVIEDTVEKDVTFLRDVDVKFVSLVRHGACQMPFRVIKSEGEGGDCRDMMIVQSILVPKHLDLAELTGKEDLEWLSDANLETGKDFEEYRTFAQEEVELFDVESMKMVKVHGEGVWALAGQLKDGASPARGIALGQTEEEAAKEIPLSPMDTPIPATAAASAAMSFKELFYRELDNMLGVVTGTLNQSGQKIPTRKKTILSAVDAFRSFLVMGLDALGQNAAKIDKVEVHNKPQPTEEEDMALFTTEEEFVEAMKGVLKDTIPGMIDEHILALQSLKDAEEKPPEEPETKETVEKTETTGEEDNKVLEAVTALAKKVDDLEKKWENDPATEATGTEGAEEETKKGDEEEETKPSVFGGLLYQTRQ